MLLSGDFQPKTSQNKQKASTAASLSSSFVRGYGHLNKTGPQPSFAKDLTLAKSKKPVQLRGQYMNFTMSRKSKISAPRRTQSVLEKKQRPYLNSTGPGEYNLPNLWKAQGFKNSRNKQGPSFSISKRCKTPLISKNHTQDMLGRGKISF